ncbi:hypothetical protein Syun_013437 [Stephania yunnanensis]|uniref:Beta-amylase n=1 Tax=Stephania yunnanensis TaxID=152371 RepID=A0AAP0PHC1_9MAGN
MLVCSSAMAIASPSQSPPQSHLRLSLALPILLRCRAAVFRPPSWRLSARPRLSASSHLNPFNTPNNPSETPYELQHELPPPPRRRGSPVYVALPVDAVSGSGEIKRRKAMVYSMRALATAGVEGVVMEVWWGLVERERPLEYEWREYLEIVALARSFGLKVRAVMAFHQRGVQGDRVWIPLPQWVRQEMDDEPDLAYSDRFGRRSTEYVSLGCDILPVLKGRSPIQAYSDFMRNFRDTFKDFLGVTITGIQVGMGPAGELRYPSCPSQKLTWSWRFRELGEFQCYDKYMLASLNACAREMGMREWGNGGPLGAWNLMQNHEETEFFRSGGSWNTPYGRFFLEWYSEMLLLHGERLCMEAVTIFQCSGVGISAKLAGLHWHYGTESHPCELTAGYYNTSIRDGYLPIARMFRRYGINMCCTCLEMLDEEEKRTNPLSSPEGLLRQIMLAANKFRLPLEGENSAARFNDESLNQVLKMSKFYSGGHDGLLFSFNFMRMGQSLFDFHNWARFTQFVRQMQDDNNLAATRDFGRAELRTFSCGAEKVGSMYVYT